MEPRNEAEAVEKLKSELSTITEEAGSSELWGEDLRSSPAASVLLAKFVRANEGTFSSAPSANSQVTWQIQESSF